MDKKNEKKVHSEDRDNIIPFPKPPQPSRGRGKEDVGSGERYTIHFEPHWDTDEDDPPDSKA